MRIAGLCLLLLGHLYPAFALDQAPEAERNPINVKQPGGPPATSERNQINVVQPGGPPVNAADYDGDVETSPYASAAVSVDLSSTVDADTDASGVSEGSLDSGSTGYVRDLGSLPETASSLPLFAVIGALALLAAIILRRRMSRS